MKKKKAFYPVLLALLLVLSLLTGCTSNNSTATPTPSAVPEEELVTDVVVVGGGVSGLNAAVFAAKNQAQVILVEKQAYLGGSALVSSGGLFTCNSNGFIDGDDSIEHAFAFWEPTAAMGKDSGYPNWDRLRYTLEKTGETVNQLVDLGVSFSRTMSSPTGSIALAENGGGGYIQALSKIAEEEKVTVMLESPATELIEENGTVIGVKVSTPEGSKNIKAKTVILATGGFSRSDEKVAEWVPEATMVYNGRAGAGNTGDGFDMALKAGAVLYDNQWLMMSTTMTDPEFNRQTDANKALSLAKSLVVNTQGVRFINENPSAYSAFGNTMIDNQDAYCYALMNATEENRAVLEQGITMNQVYKADSIENLAEQLNMDAQTLQATFDNYNQLCEKKEDTDFGKAEENLIPLEASEIYAVLYYPTSIGTIGGVKTNENHEVLREDGSVIEGLLAIGEMSNREFYNYYYIGGASLGLYSTMGRLAGEYAAQRAK